MSQRAPTATVVVGLGEAGVRMLSAVDEAIGAEDIDERRFRLLGIDSKGEDIEKNFPELSRQDRFELEAPPDIRWDHMVGETHTEYLEHGDEAASQGGVTRTRPVARALVDDSENYDALYGFFETRIQNFIDDLGTTSVNVWLLHSLGGGTGSGTFPIVGSMLDHVTGELARRNSRLGFDIAAVGSLPQLTEVHRGGYPEARPQHIINSYVALRELRGILEHDYVDRLELPLYAEDISSHRSPHIPLEEPPFDKYFLFPVLETEVRTESKRKRLNAVVADLVLYFSLTTGVENYPDTDEEYDEERLYTINAAELGFPTELARDYVETKEDLQSLDGRKTKLQRLRDEYRDMNHYVSDTLEVNRSSLPEEGSEVEERLVSECANHAEATVADNDARYLDEEQITQDAVRAVEEVRQTIRSRFQQFDIEVELGDDEVRTVVEDIPIVRASPEDADAIQPMERVIEYFYYSKLQSALEAELKRREFERAVDEAWTDYREEIRQATDDPDRFEEVDEGDAETRWDGIERYLEGIVIPDLRAELDDGGLFGLGFGQEGTEEELQQTEDLVERIRALHTAKTNLEELRGKTDEWRKAARQDLKTLRNQLEDAVEAVGDDLADLDLERQKLQNRRQTLEGRERGRNSLSEFNPERFAKMSLEQPNTLKSEDLTAIEAGEWTIQKLIDDRLTTEESLVEDLEYLVQRELDERMSDVARTKPDGLLAPLRQPKNGFIDEQIRDIVSARQTRIEHVTEPMGIRDPLTIRLLATYTPIDLDETSEYGVIHEYFENPDERVVELLTGDADSDVERRFVRFAYPELVSGTTTQPSAVAGEDD